MGNFIAYRFSGLERPEASGILIAFLDDAGYSGFVDEGDTMIAYLEEALVDEDVLSELLDRVPGSDIGFTRELVPEKNWNEEWERDYASINVDGIVNIRASFHPPAMDVEYDIVINPKMSFGTGHHVTTRLMIGALLSLQVPGKILVDLGTGTGILAILAKKIGAEHVIAVDTDEWSVRNARENINANNAGPIELVPGTVSVLSGRKSDILLANINRNTLLGEMEEYANLVTPGGKMVLSGFLHRDLFTISEKAGDCGFSMDRHFEDHSWIAAIFSRIPVL